MKIVYIAKHHSGGNDEEGSITYSLEKLGHTVERIHEKKVHLARSIEGDLILFHKYDDMGRLSQIKGIPKVCWFWDMVVFPNDGEMIERNQFRLKWLRRVIDCVDLVFMTDGDWQQANNDSGKLHVLRQGFDERNIGIGIRNPTLINDILLTATRYGWGTGRREFCDWLHRAYGQRITHRIEGVYGQELANLIVNHGVVIAPQYPMTDLYWSNRIYLTLGYGGFLLHPESKGLLGTFKDGIHLQYYSSREELVECVLYYLNRPGLRLEMAIRGMEEVAEHHTYTQRCQLMLSIINDKLGVS